MSRIMIAHMLFICLLILTGCSGSGFGQGLWTGKKIPAPRVEIINSNYNAGSDLLMVLAGRHPVDSPLLLTTFVNLDNLQETSSLGRIIPQQIGTRLTQCGFEVIDVRLRSESLLVRQNQGEFVLSRKIAEIARNNQAHSVLVGTYSVVYNQVYVNAKILRSADGLTMAATDYTLPYDPRVLNPAGFSGADQGNPLFIPNIHTSLESVTF